MRSGITMGQHPCYCKDPEAIARRRGKHTAEYCQACRGRIGFRAMSFNFDRIDWDEERFPEGAPYAGKTFKDVAAINPNFVKWYADATNCRVQRDIAKRAVRELHL